MPRDHDPARRKALERARDRFDAFGENQKAARRNLRRKKARAERVHRRAVRIELRRGVESDAGRLRRTRWRKWSGPTVDEGLANKKRRREALAENPRRSPDARARRAARRAGTRR